MRELESGMEVGIYLKKTDFYICGYVCYESAQGITIRVEHWSGVVTMAGQEWEIPFESILMYTIIKGLDDVKA